jgi:outer membrane protein OmpA-like peptidoglycan-associated protein
MRKQIFLSIIGMFIFSGIFFLDRPASAQTLFQNNNTNCESELILCSSVSNPSNCDDDAHSVACKNFAEAADFNGDTFPDCAAASNHTSSTTDRNVSVLINQGTAATACSPGPGDQFRQPTLDYVFTGISDTVGNGLDIATITVGQLNGIGNTDIAVPTAFSTAGERIANALDPDPINIFGADESPVTTTDVNWVPTGRSQSGFDSTQAEPTMALLDCDNNGTLDAALVVEDFSPGNTIRLNVLRNNGSGLQDINTGGSSVIVSGAGITTLASLAVADFDNDGDQDVAVAVNDSVQSEIVLCVNNGACGFGCSPAITLDQHVGQNPAPFSIAAGDFNGDGNQDLVITEPNLNNTPGNEIGIHYFFGNGNGTFSTPGTHVAYNQPAGGVPKVLTTGCFNNDNVIDLAVSYDDSPTGNVGIITSNGTGGLNTPLTLAFASPTDTVDGIDAADFDKQGGDDLIVLGNTFVGGNNTREAFVFMNSLETLSANAGANQNVDLNTPLVLSGASCAYSPNDPTAAFAIQWTLVNPTTGATVANATSLNPTFTATVPGTYTLNLECRSRCFRDAATSTMQITVPSLPLGTSTQGASFVGCGIVQLSSESGGFMEIVSLLIPVGFMFMKRKRAGRKNFRTKSLFLIVFLVGLLSANFAHALTTSFSTNFFKPVVDDSEYFSVYSSPTMKKANYHFGLWLDYAHHPYEVGDTNFNRVSGITDSLFTGNFVGSYSFFDWLNVGGRLPIYFLDAIRAPLLGRPDENHINIGDLELDFKFQLLDRKKKKVGISVLPFVTVPTATHAARDFMGNGSVTGGAKVILDGKIKDRVSLALNAGYETRNAITEVGGNKIDDHLLLGGGVSVDIIKKHLRVIGETQVETVVSDFFKRRTTPAEARLGLRYRFKNGLDVNAGGGLGYTNGISSPDFRAFAGVTYTRRPIGEFELKEPGPGEVELKEKPIEEVTVGEELTLSDKIFFEFDKAVIRDISKPPLDKIAAFIKAHPEIKKLRVEGHTDSKGTDRYNQKLSERRANSVVTYLVGQGVNRSILHAVGYGESKPIAPNTDEAGREKNRRVQIFVEEKE